MPHEKRKARLLVKDITKDRRMLHCVRYVKILNGNIT